MLLAAPADSNMALSCDIDASNAVAPGMVLQKDFCDDVDLGGFFAEVAHQLCIAMKAKFQAKLDEQRDELRRSYDRAVRHAQENATAQLSELIKELRLPAGKAVGAVRSSVATASVCTAAEETVILKSMIAEVRENKHSFFASEETMPYSHTTWAALQGTIDESQALIQCSTQCMGRLIKHIDVNTISGREYHVDVFPAVDRVSDLFGRLREQEEDIAGHDLNLCLNTGIKLRRGDRLKDYDLDAGLVMSLDDMTISDLRARVKFDGEDLRTESVSGQEGFFTHHEYFERVDVDGRVGVRFSDRCCYRLPAPVEVGPRWTIAAWTLMPINFDQGYRVLLDGARQGSLILVAFQRSEVCFLNRPVRRVECVEGFSLATLDDGWHHIAAVGNDGEVTYYIDGEQIGQLQCPLQGSVAVVGNCSGGPQRRAFGVVSDFRIYGTNASPEQVLSLATA